MPHSLRVALLPLALVLAVVLGLGSYYEAADDAALAWLFGGALTGGRPVAALPLYFHGYGHGLAVLYGAAPGVAWLGLGLGAALLAATVLAFAVLDKLLRPHLRPAQVALALTVFFGVGWLEHWLWFSYVRVALLLAGAAVLYAAQRPGRRGPLLLGLAGLGAAWAMRPGLAPLVLVAVAPAAVLLAGGLRRAAPVLLGSALLLALATAALAARRTPAEARTQAFDGYLARILDFEQLTPRPRTASDRRATAAIGLWLLGDSASTNAALCRRAYVFDAPTFFLRTAPAKIGQRLGLLARDYFPLLLALAATAGAGWRGRLAGHRRGFWLVQMGYAGALLALAGIFKLPPRLALPLLDFWLLTNVAFWMKAPLPSPPGAVRPGPPPPLARRPRVALLAAGALVLALYGAKTWHRYRVLSHEQARHVRSLGALGRLPAGQVRVLAGTVDWGKSLSPFRGYSFGPGPVLNLSGWPSHDASQAAFRRALTGAGGQPEALRRLAARPPGAVAWVLGRPEAAWLGPALAPARLRPLAPWPGDTAVRRYALVPGQQQRP